MRFIENKFFATGEQELLLRAALLEGSDAAGALKAWVSVSDLESHLDDGIFDLLPLLYMNMHRLGMEYPEMGRLKGIYRQVWYKNQKRFFEACRILDSMHKAGIRTMVIKGIPMAILYYKKHGVCPIRNIDILVPSSQAIPAIASLKKTGRIPTTASVEEHMLYQPSLQFTEESGGSLKLHWNLIFRSCSPDSDSGFWEKARPVKIHDVATYAPDATDMLFHVIVSGIRSNPERSVCWIADAVTIIQSSHQEIDWPRMIHHARKHIVFPEIKEALGYLNETFRAKVPKTIMESFNSIPMSFLEQIDYQFDNWENRACRETLFGGFPLYIIDYLRLSRDTEVLPALVGFPGYLKYRLHEKNFLYLLFFLFLRIMRTARKKITGVLSGVSGEIRET
jgi:hypothetical protein